VPERSGNTARTTLYVTLIIFASKGVGFVRDMIRAAYFGTSVANDAYVGAYTLFYIPILLLTSMITSTMIPLYIDARTEGGNKLANRFASNTINLFSLIAMALSLLMMVFARPLCELIFQGYDQQRLDMTVHMANIMMPSLVFVLISTMLSSVLNATKHFVAAQMAGFGLSIGMIGATIFLSPVIGSDSLAWGIFIAGILQAVILLPGLRKDFRYSLSFQPSDPRFKKVIALGLPAFMSMAVTEMSHTVDQAISSTLGKGSISALDYGYRLIAFIAGVIGVPVVTIMFSRMSEREAAKDREGIKNIAMQAVEALLTVLLPIVVLGCVLSDDIIRVVYTRGAFDEQSMYLTSGVFFCYLIGVVSFCVSDLLNRAFHSMQKTRLTMWVSLFVMISNAVISILLARFIGVNGLALGTVISSFMGTAILLTMLRKQLGKLGLKSVALEIGKIVLAGLAALALSVALRNLMSGRNDLLQVLLRLAASGGAGVLAYLGVLKMLGARQLSFIKVIVGRKS
jgi:putative peptidoglycan lipid II flippase